MTLLGQTRQDLPFPVCSQFQPTVLEGQLCFYLDLSLTNTKTKEGLKNGLVLIPDPSSQEYSQPKQTQLQADEFIRSLNFEPQKDVLNSAKIYLNTLASFADFRTGSYAVSAVKRMQATHSFMQLPDAEKNCQIETFEDCQTNGYIKAVEAKCGCVPWALSSALPLEDPVFCSPKSSSCYTTVSRDDQGCRVSCTGLYADVEFIEDKILKTKYNIVKGELGCFAIILDYCFTQ